MSTGYGTSVWCDTGAVTGRLVSGWRAVAQSLFRRVTTPRGTLRGVANGGEEAAAFGIDLADYVGAVGYDASVRAIPSIVRAEWMKDERVANVELTAFVTTDAAGLVTITLDALVFLVDEGEDFALTIAVSSGGVQLVLAEAA